MVHPPAASDHVIVIDAAGGAPFLQLPVQRIHRIARGALLDTWYDRMHEAFDAPCDH